MKFRLLLFLCLICAADTSVAQDAVTVVEDSVLSASISGQMKFYALLPRHYNENHERHPVLYLLHGFAGGYTDWLRKSELARHLRGHDFIVITPDAKNSWYTNALNNKNARYEDCIMNDLIPFVEAKYRTLGTTHGRAIAGLSMGGYGALKLAIKYRKFFFAGSFSGALYAPAGFRPGNPQISGSLQEVFGETRSDQWTKNDLKVLIDSVAAKDLPYLYLCTGADDAFTTVVETNRALAEKLRSKGALYEYHETPGQHNWAYWDKELPNFLRRLALYDPLRP